MLVNKGDILSNTLVPFFNPIRRLAMAIFFASATPAEPKAMKIGAAARASAIIKKSLERMKIKNQG